MGRPGGERQEDGRGSASALRQMSAQRAQDAAREADPDWYRRRDLLGMMLYTGAFAGDLKGVQKKLPYLEECGVNYLHLPDRKPPGFGGLLYRHVGHSHPPFQPVMHIAHQRMVC